MPAHKTPLDLATLNGRHLKDPGRYADRAPPPEQNDPIGEAPELRMLTFAEAWAAIIDMCPDGVLRRRDRGMVAEAARLHMEIHNLRTLQLMDGKHWALIDGRTSKLYQSYLARLGCSPTDCNNVHIPKKPAKANEFADG